tara:strand:- start:656691 stop:657761 length:1071 start_codon:yes stop_codon:yes gene_type:complete
VSTPQRILIVGPSWVGDMVMAQSLFIELRHRNPEAVIDVLAPAWSRPLLARMPQVRQAIDLPLAHREVGLGKRFRLGRTLAERHYDQAILLPNSFKSALVPLFAGIPLRTGWRGEKRGWVLNDCRDLDKQTLPLMVQRFVALGLPADSALPVDLPDPLPVPQLQVNREQARQVCEQFALPPGQRLLMLCPGAEFGDAKRWPCEHYAEVAKEHINKGWHVVLMGSAKDQAVTGEIAALTGNEACHDLAGKTSLDQAIDLLSQATAVVSNDSGLMHIAAALHRPLVAVYGSTSADFTPPLSDQVAILNTDIDCRPCFQRECPLQHKRCLTELEPSRVIKALERLSASIIVGDMQPCVS